MPRAAAAMLLTIMPLRYVTPYAAAALFSLTPATLSLRLRRHKDYY